MGATEARQPTGERHDFVSLCLAPAADLELAMRLGVRPDMGEMAGWEYKGYVTSQLATLAGASKLKKGFHREDETRDPDLGICGCNVECHPGTLGEPWIEKTEGGRQVRHGWFDVYPVSLAEVDNRYPNALLFSYRSSPRNFALSPLRALRDYVVQVYPDDPHLLLGKIYVGVGRARLFFSFFVLLRHNEALPV